MRREPNVDRQNPELAQHLQQALFGGNRQGKDNEVYSRAAREFDEIVDRAELGKSRHNLGRALVRPVVENTENLQIGLKLLGELLQEAIGGRSAADEHGAPDELPGPDQIVDGKGERSALEAQQDKAAAEPGEHEAARIDIVEPKGEN